MAIGVEIVLVSELGSGLGISFDAGLGFKSRYCTYLGTLLGMALGSSLWLEIGMVLGIGLWFAILSLISFGFVTYFVKTFGSSSWTGFGVEVGSIIGEVSGTCFCWLITFVFHLLLGPVYSCLRCFLLVVCDLGCFVVHVILESIFGKGSSNSS